MLNIEVATKWAEELENHPEKLGSKGKLHVGQKFCVWGVLCELHRKETHGKWDRGKYLGTAYGVPDEVKDWVGGNVYSPVTNESIMTLYDFCEYSAKELADVIRENIRKAQSEGIQTDNQSNE